MPKPSQRAVIYLTDREDGKVDYRIEFEPSVKKRDTRSPAVDVALDVIEYIKRQHMKPLIVKP